MLNLNTITINFSYLITDVIGEDFKLQHERATTSNEIDEDDYDE